MSSVENRSHQRLVVDHDFRLHTSHSNDKENQTILADVVSDKLLNQTNVAWIFVLADRLDDTGKVKERQVCDGRALDRKADNILAESEFLPRVEREGFLGSWQRIVDKLGRRDRGVENSKLGSTKSSFDEGRIGDDRSEGDLRDVVERLRGERSPSESTNDAALSQYTHSTVRVGLLSKGDAARPRLGHDLLESDFHRYSSASACSSREIDLLQSA